MGALRVRGDIRQLRKRTKRIRSGRSVNGAISTTFRGNARAALSVTNTERTLGASTRQGFRLAVTPQERKAHGSSVTLNTAEYVAYNGPNTHTGYGFPLISGAHNGRKDGAK